MKPRFTEPPSLYVTLFQYLHSCRTRHLLGDLPALLLEHAALHHGALLQHPCLLPGERRLCRHAAASGVPPLSIHHPTSMNVPHVVDGCPNDHQAMGRSDGKEEGEEEGSCLHDVTLSVSPPPFCQRLFSPPSPTSPTSLPSMMWRPWGCPPSTRYWSSVTSSCRHGTWYLQGLMRLCYL